MVPAGEDAQNAAAAKRVNRTLSAAEVLAQILKEVFDDYAQNLTLGNGATVEAVTREHVQAEFKLRFVPQGAADKLEESTERAFRRAIQKLPPGYREIVRHNIRWIFQDSQ